MLSLSNVSGGQAASGYYHAEGYYLDGSPEAAEASQYIGKGAEEAGFVGQIKDADFKNLLDGVAPDGSLQGRIRDGEREHRPGIDLTFSAPKSVSIAALVGGDKAIIAAHNEAVKAAFSYVEQSVAQTRVVRAGVIHTQHAEKLIAGAFMHDTSRALDPHLHTHVVIANMVACTDGRYRALHNDEIYKQTLIIGQVYRNELANRLEDAGYTVKWDSKGLFEIDNVSREVIDHFSTRRQEIVDALEKGNFEATSRNSQLAALVTRTAKQPVERSELYQAWRDEAKSIGFAYKQPSPDQSAKSSEQDKAEAPSADKALQYAVEHLRERQSVYPVSEVIRTAIVHNSRVSPRDVLGAINARVEGEHLFRLRVEDQPYLTDRDTVRMEIDNIKLLTALKDQSKIDVRTLPEKALARSAESIVSSKRLFKSTLTDGQKEAVTAILTSPDKVVGVQGLAGTGKTYMLATAVKHFDRAGYTVEGLAPSHKAVTALSEAIPDSRTVSSALVRHDNAPGTDDRSKTVLVVDEASMLSSKQMNDILKMAVSKNYARVVLVGDVKQLDAVGAGSSFRQLQAAGMHTAQMLDIQRQSTLEGRTAVLMAASGNVRAAFEGLSDVYQTPDSRSAIAQETARQYLAKSPEDRQKTGIVIMTNAMRREVNSAIQIGLREERGGPDTKIEIDTLDPRHFTTAEAGEVRSYDVKDIVMPLKHIKSAGLEAGVEYRVTGKEEDNRILSLQAPDGSTKQLELDAKGSTRNKLVVFQDRKETFYQGDQVKFKITDRDHGIVNSNAGTIANIGKDHIVIRDEDGRRQSLPMDSLAVKGMSLAYSSTAHDFQGSTIDNVLLAMHSKEQLATQKGFYVGLSRMRHETALITDNAGRLQGTIQTHTGERLNALEALATATAERLKNEAQKQPVSEPEKGAENERQKAPVLGREDDHKSTDQQPPEVDKSDASKEASEAAELADAQDPQRKAELKAELEGLRQILHNFERGERSR